MHARGERVASLDGLRAISILMVVFSHLAGTRGFPPFLLQVFPPFLGTLGVRVFFVISGFLITRLLLIELRQRGSIHLGAFYFRRTLRILVPYYVFLAAVYAAARFGWVRLQPGDFAYALAYLTNYHPHGGWVLAHSWSLAVEEQFYLLWPALLVVLGVRRSMWVAAAYIVAAPIGRFLLWSIQPGSHEGMGHTFFTSADTIAAGCLLAAVSDALWRNARYQAVLRSRWFLLVPAAVLAAGAVDSRPRIAFSVGAVVVNVGVAIGVDRCLRMPWRLSTRVLSLPAVVAIGRVSYSLYLWQQIFIDRSSTRWATSFPRNALFASVAAVASFYLIERPSLSARVALQAWLGRTWRRRVAVEPPAPQLPAPARRTA
jgi:peptidoglycan/LPS O-acetylase OafA/YrhL